MIKTTFNVIMIKPINIIFVEQRESFKMFLYLSYNIKILTNIFFINISAIMFRHMIWQSCPSG